MITESWWSGEVPACPVTAGVTTPNRAMTSGNRPWMRDGSRARMIAQTSTATAQPAVRISPRPAASLVVQSDSSRPSSVPTDRPNASAARNAMASRTTTAQPPATAISARSSRDRTCSRERSAPPGRAAGRGRNSASRLSPTQVTPATSIPALVAVVPICTDSGDPVAV